MNYPIPSVRVVVGKKVVFERLNGGETWEEAARLRVKEKLGLDVKTKFLGMGAPVEKDGEWWLPAEFEGT